MAYPRAEFPSVQVRLDARIAARVKRMAVLRDITMGKMIEELISDRLCDYLITEVGPVKPKEKTAQSACSGP